MVIPNGPMWPMFGCGASHSVLVLDPCWSSMESLAAATTAPPSFTRKTQHSQPTPSFHHWKTFTTSNAWCKLIPRLFRDIQTITAVTIIRARTNYREAFSNERSGVDVLALATQAETCYSGGVRISLPWSLYLSSREFWQRLKNKIILISLKTNFAPL